MKTVFAAAFPACLVQDDAWLKLPSATTLSRAQLLIDAAFCSFIKTKLQLCHFSDMFTYMFADSSPQAGNDWLLATCQMIAAQDLLPCIQAAQVMRRNSWQTFERAVEEGALEVLRQIVQQRDESGQFLKNKIQQHRLIPMAIGSGASSLDHKTRAIARALFSETQSVPDLTAFLSGVISVTPDMGVELAVGDVSGLPVRNILPSWLQELIQRDCEGLSELGQSSSMSMPNDFFMPRAVVVPGLNHIINNMCSDANKSMRHWDDWLVMFRPVDASLHHRHLRNRFIASCLQGSPHAWMEARFQVAPPSFAEWRWGSAVSVLQVLLPLGPLLRRAWDPAKFASSQSGVGDLQPAAGDRAEQLETVDEKHITQAIRSTWFWSFGKNGS